MIFVYKIYVHKYSLENIMVGTTSKLLNIFWFTYIQILTHLSQMDLPTLICRTCPYPILGVLGGIFFFFFQISIEHSVIEP